MNQSTNCPFGFKQDAAIDSRLPTSNNRATKLRVVAVERPISNFSVSRDNVNARKKTAVRFECRALQIGKEAEVTFDHSIIRCELTAAMLQGLAAMDTQSCGVCKIYMLQGKDMRAE